MNISEPPLSIISNKLPPDWLKSLSGSTRLLIGPEETPELDPTLVAHLAEASGLFSLLTVPVTDSLLEQAPQLKVVSNMAVGVDNVDIAACTRRGIPVGHTPGVLTEGTADLAFALLLSIARRIPEASEDAKQGKWKTWSPTGWLGYDLSGAKLGIIGMGKIGRAVARRAVAFGMSIYYADSKPCPNMYFDMGGLCLPLDSLLETCDVISLHVPLTQDTFHLMNAERLKRMQPTAILINTARGPIVDTQALTTALVEGWIAAAALDVTDPEPLPPDHPLYSLPNCLITPHIGSATHLTRRKMAELACANLLAGLRNEVLPHCVNPEVYR